jgi:hypothetical protein
MPLLHYESSLFFHYTDGASPLWGRGTFGCTKNKGRLMALSLSLSLSLSLQTIKKGGGGHLAV